jgi:hypothetical protein
MLTLVNVLWIKIKMRSVDLIKTPQQILGSLVDIVSSRVIRKVRGERRAGQFLLKNVNLVEEQDDARSHEPSRVDNRVKEEQTFHHTVL